MLNEILLCTYIYCRSSWGILLVTSLQAILTGLVIWSCAPVPCSAPEAHACADSNTAAGGRIGTHQMSSFVANARHSARVRAPTNVRKSVCQEASPCITPVKAPLPCHTA